MVPTGKTAKDDKNVKVTSDEQVIAGAHVAKLPQSTADSYFDWIAASTGKTTTTPTVGAVTPDQNTQNAAATAKAKQSIGKQFGVAPHSFLGFVDGVTQVGGTEPQVNERAVLAALPAIVARLNAVAEKRGLAFRFTEAELMTNFISEGGALLLESPDAIEGPIDGYQYLGIDTFMSRVPELDRWMSQELRDYAADSSHSTTNTNEQQQQVQTLNPRDLAMGLEANAVMFAASRNEFNRDCLQLGISPKALPKEAWFFWTTVYYNSGPGRGMVLLRQYGINYWQSKWTLPDDVNKYGGNSHYNAAWRTASYELLRERKGDHLDMPNGPVSTTTKK